MSSTVTKPGCLRLSAVWKNSTTEPGVFGGWVTTVIDEKGAEVFVGPRRAYRQESLDDGRAWCKANRPGVKIVIG